MYLKGYPAEEKSFLVNGFRFGFHIPSSLDLLPRSSSLINHPSALNNYSVTTEKIAEEVRCGRVIGPFDTKPSKLICSPLALIPKKEPGKFRLIHNLSFPKGHSINSSIDSCFTEVCYDSIDTVVNKVKLCGRGCLMAKTDIENAFRLIPIHPNDRHLLGFSWNHSGVTKFYMDACLAMGLSISCQLFSRFSNALQWIMESKFNGVMSHIIDDFFFAGPPTSMLCKQTLEFFLELCEHINVPLKMEKTVSPTTCITIYGIEIDSMGMEARLPLDKVIRISQALVDMEHKRKVQLKELQSLLGLLNFACSCIVPGRTFLRRLYDLTVGHIIPTHYIRLNCGARADLQMWSSFMQTFNGRCMFLNDTWLQADSLHLHTDAALSVGFAAVFGTEWVAERWSPSMKLLHINVLELIPIVVAVELWGHKMANHRILFHSDNEATVYVINKMTSKDKLMMKWVRRLVFLSMKHNILFRASHIPGNKNILADSLSRFDFQKAFQVAPHLQRSPLIIPPQVLDI